MLRDDSLEIRSLLVTGTPVRAAHATVKSGTAPAIAVRQMLELGGSILEHGTSQSTLSSVAAEVDRLLAGVVEAAEERLPESLNQHVTKLGGVLAERFDSRRVDSVQRQILAMVEGASVEQRRALISALLDDEGPLGGLKAELAGRLSVMAARQDELLRQITAVGERIAAHDAIQAERDKGTAKGADFESFVATSVDWSLAPYGDVVVEVGNETGTQGNKAGDIMVTLNPDETSGHDLRIVVEAKCRPLGLKAALRELDRALDNWDAHSGILVFAEPEQAPLNGRCLRLFAGNRIMCVLGRESGDRLPLEVACQLARALSLTSAQQSDSQLDAAALSDDLRILTEILDEAKAIIHAPGVDYQQYSRAQAEVIVDSVTLVVLGGLGLDVSGETIPYVAGWGEDGALEAVTQFAKLIDALAHRLEAALSTAGDGHESTAAA
jgi:hypothetical protein